MVVKIANLDFIPSLKPSIVIDRHTVIDCFTDASIDVAVPSSTANSGFNQVELAVSVLACPQVDWTHERNGIAGQSFDQ